MSILGRLLPAAINRRSIAVSAALACASTAMVVAAVNAEGTKATNVQLDDGAVWVTNAQSQRVGRLNLRVDELDFAIVASAAPDVRQDGRSVVFSALDGGVARLDVITGEVTGRNAVPVADYQVNGGVGFVLDRSSGRFWVGRADTIVAPDHPDKPDGMVAPGSHAVVTDARPDRLDAQGNRRGSVWIIEPGGSFELPLDERLEPRYAAEPPTEDTTGPAATEPQPEQEAATDEPPALEPVPRRELGVDFDDIAAVTSVGGQPVLLLDDGRVVTHRQAPRAVPGEQAKLQQPGPEADAVLVATTDGLFEVPLGAGAVQQRAAADASPAAPVRVRDCSFGAWSGAVPTWVRRCGNRAAEPQPIEGAAPGVELVYRVNGSNVALNSPGDGGTWANHDGELTFVGNWDDLEEQPDDSELDNALSDTRTVVEKTCVDGNAEAPVTGDDQLGARPRQSILDLLANDDDPNCEPIAITAVEPASGPWGQLTIIDNGQHVLFSPSDELVAAAGSAVQSVQFTYRVEDAAGNASNPATASVLVKARAVGNAAPALRPKANGATRQMRTVVEAGRATSYDVLADWWDPDGDDLRLVSASPPGSGEVSSTPDGIVRFAANGVAPGIVNVPVTMSDGVLSGTEQLEVTVKPTGSALAPVALNDFLTVVAGSEAAIDPLANDADPNEDPLEVRPLWLPDPEANFRSRINGHTVHITALTAGVYLLPYEATDGIDATRAYIRLRVLAPDGTSNAPVAVPDQVKVRVDRVINVDVLANDVDVDGDVLAVTDVTVQNGDPAEGTVRAGIVDRRLVQLEVVAGAEGVAPTGPFVVHYTVSDGRAAERAATQTVEQNVADELRARGAITVLIQPATDDQPPIPADDNAVVRSGDIVTVAVLRNDRDPDADPLTLEGIDEAQAAAIEAAGQGVVWTEGRNVLFQGGAPGRTTLLYRTAAGGKQATGQLTIDVTAAPDPATNPNQAPQPANVVLRAIRNSQVRLGLPLHGTDPDGDTVTVVDEFTGLQGAGAGNRVSVDPEDPQVVLFEAGPAAPAADSFDYTVVDAHGARATARVTVLVLDDGGWAPLAHDDVYIGRPGRTISVPTLANDTSPQDRRLELAELPFFGADGQPTADAQHPDAVSVRDQRDPANRGRIDVVVPSDGTTLVEHYRISDGRSGSDAFVRVSPDPQAPNLPPVANTDVVALEESRGVDSVEVDVLRNDVDPDDAGAALTVTIPGGQNATVAGSTVVVPIETKARTVLYRVTDADGGAAVGRIRVPGDENHPPVLSELGRDRDQRRIPPGTSEPITLTVAALVADPDGDPDLALTAREIAVLGGTGEVRRTESGDGFVFTPPAERQQQTIAAIQFEVTDRPALSEAERQQPGCNCTALLTVEAVIEASSPPRVLTQGSVRVPQLDEPVSFDLAPLATDDQGDPLSFAVDGAAAGGLDVQLDGTVLTVVSRRSGADKLPVGATVPIAFTVSDGTFDPVAGTVVATVIQTNRGQPSAGALPTQDAERDEPINLPNLVALASNPFPDRPLELVNATVDNGATVTCTPDGTCTFRSSTVGTFTVGYTLRDAVEQTARGTVTVVVKGKPRAPGVPSVRSVGDKRVTLAWTAADLQGGSLVAYHVTAVEAGTTKTFTGTGGEFDGLQNGRTYHFTVRAENELGMGEESAPSSEAVPDRVPDPPVALRITDYQDQQLTLQWSPPASAGDYTAIRAYRIQIGGQSLTVNDGSQTSLVVGRGGVGSPLQNGTAHTFRIQAQNAAATNGGWGAYSPDSAAETPSRYPDPPTGVAATNSGDGGSPRLTVTWAAPVSNGGRAVNQYRVCQVQTPANCATTDGATRQATFDLPRNQQASFTVIAFNTDKNRNNSEPSAASPPATTVGNPDPPVISQVASANHRLTVSATSTNGSGCSTYSIEYAINGGAWQASNVFNGLTNGTRYTVSARTRLPATCTGGLTFVSSAVTANGTPYGPLVQPSITSSRNGNVITWNWSTNRADDGRPDWSASLGGPCAAVAVSAGSHTQDFGAGPQTQTCTITVSAGGVPSLSASSSQTIPAPPAPTLDAWLSPNGAPISGSYWVHGSGTNWPAGARYYIQCRDAGGAYVDTRNNIPVSYAARYVGGDGQLSWGNSICYTNTAADEVRVWVEGGPDMTVTIG